VRLGRGLCHWAPQVCSRRRPSLASPVPEAYSSSMPMSCPLCDQELPSDPQLTERNGENDVHLFTCPVCGRFLVRGSDVRLQTFDDREAKPRRYLLSAIARSATEPILIDRKLRDDLRNGIPRDKTVLEKIELAIEWFADNSSEMGDEVATVLNRDYPVAWCKGQQEWMTLLDHLSEDLGLLSIDSLNSPEALVSVTVEGWKWVQGQPKGNGSKVFIAMAFDSSLDPVKAAIEAAIRDAGYDPIRVDDDDFNGGIMDRIIGHIRESRFIVADFTKNRGGVYYEAGVAFGLGLEVINVCAAACFDDASGDKLHFDVQHLNFIPWTADALPILADRIQARILARFGRGPGSPAL
jgi:hypothetical protein